MAEGEKDGFVFRVIPLVSNLQPFVVVDGVLQASLERLIVRRIVLVALVLSGYRADRLMRQVLLVAREGDGQLTAGVHLASKHVCERNMSTTARIPRFHYARHAVKDRKSTRL